MIKYNNSNINDWYYDTSDIIKVYRNNAVCYYKIVTSGDTPTQVPCYAVVDDISQYQDREFVDVYNKADEKWYKLNNLNQYEKYGVYGSGRTITYYEGKLTIDGNNEYMYSGSSWINVGEVSGSSVTVYSPEYLERDASHNGYVSLGEYFQKNTKIEIDFQMTHADGYCTIGDYYNTDNDDWRIFINHYNNPNNYITYDFNTDRKHYVLSSWANRLHLEIGNYYIKDLDSGNYLINATKKTNFTRPNQMYIFNLETTATQQNTDYGHIYSLKIWQGDTLVKDFIPWTDLNGNYGLYDKVSLSAHTSTNQMTGSSTVNTVTVSGETEYPIYYDEKAEPPNNLTFSSMTEAEEYECPWVGMKATIDGVKYIFSGDSQSGYEWVEDTNHYLPDVPFMLNYNAKNYNSSTYSIAKTEGQLKDVDAVCNYGYKIVDHSSDGYISVTGNSRMLLSGSTYLGRNNTQTGCTMTIVSKVKTSSGYSILTNRRGGGNYMNWMWRYPTNGIFLHGSSSYNNPLYFTTTTNTPIIASIKTYYDNGVKQQLNDWTNSGSYSGTFQYGTLYNGESSLFCDYTNNNSEFWKGDFYWVYMSQNVLTDEQIQQVIDYNENL